MPVHIVEGALTGSARANYLQSFLQQAVAWRTAAPWGSRPYDSRNGSRVMVFKTVLARLTGRAPRQTPRPRPTSMTQSLLEKGHFCPR
eukprot:2041112-Pyramimonas_sp.AAC.1